MARRSARRRGRRIAHRHGSGRHRLSDEKRKRRRQESNRRYYLERLEARRAEGRRYAAEHREQARENTRRWAEQHPEERKDYAWNYKRRPEVRDRQTLRQLRQMGIFTVPKTFKTASGAKMNAKQLLSAAKLGTADMTSPSYFQKHPLKATRQDFRRYGLSPEGTEGDLSIMPHDD